MKTRIVLFLLIVAMSMLSCVHSQSVPYAITEPECKVGSIENFHNFAGVHFNFYNNSEKPIYSIAFSFLVFDSDGESSPLIGSNIFSARIFETVEGHDMREVVFSLDPYISQVPNEPYIIDFFYISKIEYIDGTNWTDPYGAWMPGNL